MSLRCSRGAPFAQLDELSKILFLIFIYWPFLFHFITLLLFSMQWL
jgi:hypothetical protein